MERRKLGNTDFEVSKICLGTMTWGEQNSEAEAHAQLDMAVDHGVNFIDTAEAYPIPMKAETQGRTETYIGRWLEARKNRDRLVIATKVAGPGLADHLRPPRVVPSREQITQAVEGSLQRLGIDCIDLYQIHWPDRRANFFGGLAYTHRPRETDTPIEETLEAMDALVKAGKVRHIGLSNETAWGAMRYLHLSETQGWARPVSIQNPYNLLNRSFEVGLAEVAHREALGLLAYSPLSFGVLSGKYLDGARPEGARLTLYPRYARYTNPIGVRATEKYVALAREWGLDPGQMALAFVNDRPFVTANIIGATSLEQLKTNLGSAELRLDPELYRQIEAVHAEHTYPCP